jgi:UDP-glucose 4-epimerase
MIKHDCKNIIFSSSATVYGTNECSQENSQLTPMNPYGSTKVCIEYMLKDMSIAYKDFSFISLRYYNPCK